MPDILKHTPGPWTVKPSVFDDWGAVKTVDGQELICHARNPSVNSRDFHIYANGGQDPFEANARLIAAAPELLEAVEAVISHWFYAEEEGGVSGDEAIKKCLAVAAKATGQEPQTQT
jgi:hypothetical protein